MNHLKKRTFSHGLVGKFDDVWDEYSAAPSVDIKLLCAKPYLERVVGIHIRNDRVLILWLRLFTKWKIMV